MAKTEMTTLRGWPLAQVLMSMIDIVFLVDDGLLLLWIGDNCEEATRHTKTMLASPQQRASWWRFGGQQTLPSDVQGFSFVEVVARIDHDARFVNWRRRRVVWVYTARY